MIASDLLDLDKESKILRHVEQIECGDLEITTIFDFHDNEPIKLFLIKKSDFPIEYILSDFGRTIDFFHFDNKSKIVENSLLSVDCVDDQLFLTLNKNSDFIDAILKVALTCQKIDVTFSKFERT